MSRPVCLTLALSAVLAAGGCRAAQSQGTPAPPATGAAPAASESAAPPLVRSHAPVSEQAEKVEPVAPAPGGLSIADVWARRKTLAGTSVTVRGRVVKANNQILGKNWIHLQDGTGSAADRTHDLTVTTTEEVKVGEVITVTGVLATARNIGEGYVYDAIIEEAKVVR